MLELLMSEWEDLLEDVAYEPVHHALQAGITLLEKYYHRADDTDAYFIAHGKSCCVSVRGCDWSSCLVLDPVLKLEYLKATWDQEYLEYGMKQFNAWVSVWFIYWPHMSIISFSSSNIRQSIKQPHRNQCQCHQNLVCFCIANGLPWNWDHFIELSSTDLWMESVIKKRQKKKGLPAADTSESERNSFEKIERYLKQPRLCREDCPNPIPWWGVSLFACLSLVSSK